MKKLFVLSLLLLFACARNVRKPIGELTNNTVDFPRLLNELTDLPLLAERPEFPYSFAQASSYDRRTTNPYDKTETNWFGNADAGQYIRVERINGTNEYVMMDAAGPGAVVRIWSANPKAVIKIYFDGTNEPSIEMPMSEMLGGTNEFFPMPISHISARGWNSYMPLPYKKHCKISTTQKDCYYHIGYRTYEIGTDVETYSKKIAKENINLINKTAEKLKNPETVPYFINIDHMVDFSADLNLDAVYKYNSEPKTPGRIYSFICNVFATNLTEVLRDCLLEIYFDNNDEPYVSAPLGAFFGTAPGRNIFRSLPLGVLNNGEMYCHWTMPFKDNFKLRISNYSDERIFIKGNIIFSKEKWQDGSRYFHAKWNDFPDMPTRPFFDMTFLKFYGKGALVGCMMSINNHSHRWWGEGDEKIFIDNEYFPSVFGTGSEDFFGYAWGDTTLFSHAYHNQARVDNKDWFGNTCNSRFMIIDNIPFENSLQFDMEMWTHVATTVDVASVVYWYSDENR